MTARWIALISALALLSFQASALAQDCGAAKREMAFGEAAAEDAKDAAGFKMAAEQFSNATRKAPGCAAAFYNLGVVQEKAGEYSAAKSAFENYLKLAPRAADAAEVEKRIFKLEYRMQRGETVATSTARPAFNAQSLAGEWLITGGTQTYVKVTPLGGSRFEAFISKVYDHFDKQWIYYRKEQGHYVGQVDGTKVSGTLSVSGTGSCPYRVPFKGELSNGNRTITWEYESPGCSSLTGRASRNRLVMNKQ